MIKLTWQITWHEYAMRAPLCTSIFHLCSIFTSDIFIGTFANARHSLDVVWQAGISRYLPLITQCVLNDLQSHRKSITIYHSLPFQTYTFRWKSLASNSIWFWCGGFAASIPNCYECALYQYLFNYRIFLFFLF